MQLLGAEAVEEEQDDLLVGAERGGGQAGQRAVGGASAAAADDGGHQIDEVRTVVVWAGKVAEAEGIGHGAERIPEGAEKGKPAAGEARQEKRFKKELAQT